MNVLKKGAAEVVSNHKAQGTVRWIVLQVIEGARFCGLELSGGWSLA